MGAAISDVDILVDFDKNSPQFDFFEEANYYTNMSSVINSLFTPFILKDVHTTLFRAIQSNTFKELTSETVLYSIWPTHSP